MTYEDAGSICVGWEAGRCIVRVSSGSVVFDAATEIELHGDWARLSIPGVAASVILGPDSRVEIGGVPVDLWGAVVARGQEQQWFASTRDGTEPESPAGYCG